MRPIWPIFLISVKTPGVTVTRGYLTGYKYESYLLTIQSLWSLCSLPRSVFQWPGFQYFVFFFLYLCLRIWLGVQYFDWVLKPSIKQRSRVYHGETVWIPVEPFCFHISLVFFSVTRWKVEKLRPRPEFWQAWTSFTDNLIGARRIRAGSNRSITQVSVYDRVSTDYARGILVLHVLICVRLFFMS